MAVLATVHLASDVTVRASVSLVTLALSGVAVAPTVTAAVDAITEVDGRQMANTLPCGIPDRTYTPRIQNP